MFFVSLGIQWLFLLLGEYFLDFFEAIRLEGIGILLEIATELEVVLRLLEFFIDVLFDNAPFLGKRLDLLVEVTKIVLHLLAILVC